MSLLLVTILFINLAALSKNGEYDLIFGKTFLI